MPLPSVPIKLPDAREQRTSKPWYAATLRICQLALIDRRFLHVGLSAPRHGYRARLSSGAIGR